MNTRRQFLTLGTMAGLAAAAAPLMSFVPRPKQMNGIWQPRVFLFQGDSITDGNRGRDNDPNHIMGHGYAFSIASRLGARLPESGLSFYNRGISGNTVADLQARWQKDTLDLKPDVLSLLIGVNDTERALQQNDGAAAKAYEDGYRALLRQTRAQLPHCLLVLCTPFIAPVGRVKGAWSNWQAAIKQKQDIVQQLAGEYNAVLVPLQQVFDEASRRAPAEYWIWDGIHPTVAGHELITQEWLKRVGERLPLLQALQ